MSRLHRTLLLAACARLSLSPPGRAAPNRAEVSAVLFRPDGRTALSTGFDGHLRAWDATTGQELSRVEAHKGGACGAALSPDGKYLATAGADRLVRLWDAATLKP